MSAGAKIIKEHPRVFDLLRQKNIMYMICAKTHKVLIYKPNQPVEEYPFTEIEELEKQLTENIGLKRVENIRSHEIWH